MERCLNQANFHLKAYGKTNISSFRVSFIIIKRHNEKITDQSFKLIYIQIEKLKTNWYNFIIIFNIINKLHHRAVDASHNIKKVSKIFSI